MLEELLITNRQELIERCSDKSAARNASAAADADLYQHGVPLFLDQLVTTLRKRRQTGRQHLDVLESTSESTAIGRTAALHGTDLLLQGYDLDQVVREYGDVCQSVTALACELDAEITAEEFRTLNGCLDDAIADAVTAFAHAEQQGTLERQSSNNRFHAFLDEHLRLIDIAIRAHSAIVTGQVGISGATGSLLIQSLRQMRLHALDAEAELATGSDGVGNSPSTT